MIKQLEWNMQPDGDIDTNTVIGQYSIWRTRGKWDVLFRSFEIATGFDDIDDAKRVAQEHFEKKIASALSIGKFNIGDLVRKVRGSKWRGKICGFYSTSLTAFGYAVESSKEPGNVQVYPVAALETDEPPVPIAWRWRSDTDLPWQYNDGPEKPDLGFGVTYEPVFGE